ncbi:MAG: aldo/keto reductase, partial [Bacteroidetes bacterium]|nr:aldo/keto reductase [Bacteroidota bacterium]
ESLVDTALAYGDGHSEELIRSVVKNSGKRIYVATKIPPINRKWPANKGMRFHEAFTYDYIIDCTETSLKNLDVECIDIQQFHVWNDEWAGEMEWQDAVSKLKSDGKIRFVGISMNSHESENGIEAAGNGLIDVFQVFYNIFDQSAEGRLFEFCRAKNVGVIARVPFDEGALTGQLKMDTTFADGDFRNYYFTPARRREIIARVEELKKHLGDEARSLTELALRFVLQDDAVSTVIPGMRRVNHVEANCAVSDGRKLSEDLIAKLKEYHFYT